MLASWNPNSRARLALSMVCSRDARPTRPGTPTAGSNSPSRVATGSNAPARYFSWLACRERSSPTYGWPCSRPAMARCSVVESPGICTPLTGCPRQGCSTSTCQPGGDLAPSRERVSTASTWGHPPIALAYLSPRWLLRSSTSPASFHPQRVGESSRMRSELGESHYPNLSISSQPQRGATTLGVPVRLCCSRIRVLSRSWRTNCS